VTPDREVLQQASSKTRPRADAETPMSSRSPRPARSRLERHGLTGDGVIQGMNDATRVYQGKLYGLAPVTNPIALSTTRECCRRPASAAEDLGRAEGRGQ